MAPLSLPLLLLLAALVYFGLLSVVSGFNYWIPMSRLLRGEEHISSFHYNSETAAVVAFCSSAISNTAIDSNLRVPNASYILTANNCIMCGCSSNTWQLNCQPTQGLTSAVCPVAKCGDLFLGNTSVTTSPASPCEGTACLYAGYTNTTSFAILTNLTSSSMCDAAGLSPATQPFHSSASGLGLPALWSWSGLVVGIHIVLLCLVSAP